jgi:2-keto-4-pentenoate hydratase
MASSISPAAAFIEARLGKYLISTPPEFASLNDGYSVQIDMLKSEEHLSRLGGKVGWKCGATNDAAQKAMGFGPFLGPLFGSCLEKNGGAVSLSKLGSFRANEGEFCFKMKACPPLAEGRAYTADDVWDRVDSVCGAIEIAATRVRSESPLTPPAVLADFALNGCVIQGNYIPRSNFHSREALVSATASLKVNDVLAASETGANVLGDPVTSLMWLCNELLARGLQIEEGDIVMTGAAVASKQLAVGDKLEVHFTFNGSAADQVVSVILTK